MSTPRPWRATQVWSALEQERREGSGRRYAWCVVFQSTQRPCTSHLLRDPFHGFETVSTADTTDGVLAVPKRLQISFIHGDNLIDSHPVTGETLYLQPIGHKSHEGRVVVFFTRVFLAWVRMAWKGLALKSELAIIIGCRTLSSFLACGISTNFGFGGGCIQCVFPLVLGKRCALPLPDQPSILFLRRGFGRLISRGLTKDFFTQRLLVGLHRSDC
jgi:hypothetical protein